MRKLYNIGSFVTLMSSAALGLSRPKLDGNPRTRSETSALNVDCQAHEVSDLNVVDGSFFGSSRAVNSALTTVASTLRVGE